MLEKLTGLRFRLERIFAEPEDTSTDLPEEGLTGRSLIFDAKRYKEDLEGNGQPTNIFYYKVR